MVTAKLEHRPSLDGLRGLAVAAVVAFHLGHLQGGFLGVDMFFTLSGYLITRLLLIEHDSTSTISFGAFWARRAWRLLPALYVLLLALAAYAVLGATAVELEDLRGAGLATLLFVANWWFIANDAGYWDEFAVPSPLEHVWSLAIEQQFYVVWPVVVGLALRGGRAHRRLLGITVGLIAASTIWLAVLAQDDVSRAYFGSGSRAASILVGAALAVLVHRETPWLTAATTSARAPWVAGVAAAAVGASWVAIDGETDTWFYVGGYLVHALAVAVIVAVLNTRTTGPAVSVLEAAPLRRLGVISYGLYLWHWPVIVIVDAERTGVDGAALLVLRLALSVALTEASYRLVETPARQFLPGRIRPLLAFPACAAVTAVVLIVATRLPAMETFVAAPPPAAAATTTSSSTTTPPTTVLAADDAVTPTTTISTTTTTTTTVPPIDSLLVTTPSELPELRAGDEAAPFQVLLVGDSYMYDAQPGIEASLRAMGVEVASAAQLGFTITGEGWDETLANAVAEHDPDLVLAMWARFDATWLAENTSAAYIERLDVAADLLTENGALLGFIGLAPSLTAGIDREPVDRAINEIFADLPSRHPEAFYIDPDPIVAPDGEPVRTIDTPEGELLVRKVDVSHYCSDGSARFGLALGELVQNLTAISVADPSSWWLTEWRNDPRYDDPVGSCR